MSDTTPFGYPIPAVRKVSALRQRMIEDMTVRNFAPNTQISYLQQVALFARHFGKSPEQLGPEEIRAYQIYLADQRKVAVGTRIVADATQLAGKFPEWFQRASNLPVPGWLEDWKVRAIQFIQDQLQTNARQLVPLVGHIGQGILSLLSHLGFVVLVPILAFFFLKDAGRFRGWITRQFAGTVESALIQDLLSDLNTLLGKFIRALVILAAATLVVYGVFLNVIGLPYAALLAGLAGVLEFIPIIGPLSAGVAIFFVSLLSGHAGLALWIVAFLLGYRLFQDYVLQPYLMSRGVALHPLWVIFGVLAGEQLAGVPGMFLSIPALASLRVIYVRIVKARKPAEIVS